MNKIDTSLTNSYQDFSKRLKDIENILDSNEQGTLLDEVSEFIENNKTLLQDHKNAALDLDSLGARVRHLDPENPLIEKLRGLIKRLLPSNLEEAKTSLQFLRGVHSDQVQRLKSIADWIDLMKIPLANLDLSIEELGQLIPILEYINLTNYQFEAKDIEKLTNILLKPELKFNTNDEIALIELARLCAQQNGETAEFIKNFKITDEAKRQEIAILCAQKHFFSLAYYIPNFELTQKKKMEIAFLYGPQNLSTMAFNIDRFEFSDEAKMEILKQCAQVDCEETVWYIKEFQIPKEASRVEIARFCAQQSGLYTAQYIKKFRITNESARFEIGCLCAQQDGSSTAEFIKKFKIAEEPKRMEIARLCAQQSCGETARNINNFELTDESKMEIARLCAKLDPKSTAWDFKHFQITDDAGRAEIAGLCAMQQGMITAQYTKHFEILDEVKRVETARLCFMQGGLHAAIYIDNFDIRDQNTIQELFLESIKTDPEILCIMDKFSPPKELEILSKLIKVFHPWHDPDPDKRHALFGEINFLIQKLSISESYRKKIQEKADHIQSMEPNTQNAAGLWLVASLLNLRIMKQDSLEWIMDKGIWSELGLLRDPGLRILLTKGLYELSADKESRLGWEEFLSSVRGSEGQRGLMLLAIPFFAFQNMGLDQKDLFHIAKHLSSLQKDANSPLRSVYNVKTLLKTLQMLINDPAYTPKQKIAGLERMLLKDKEVKLVLSNIIAAKGLLALKDPDWPTVAEDLNSRFRLSLNKLIPLEACKANVSEKYDQIFEQSRNPSGLLTYAAGLKTLKEPEVITCLGRYVSSVLDESFINLRYETEKNPHLKLVMGKRPSLLMDWKENLTFDLEQLIIEGSKQEAFNAELWLNTKLMIDKHLGEAKLDYLHRYLTAHVESEKQSAFAGLVENIRIARKEKEKTALRQAINDSKQQVKEVAEKLKNDSTSKELSNKKASIENELAKLKKQYQELVDKTAKDPHLAELNFQKACITLIKESKADGGSLIQALVEIEKTLKVKTEPENSYAASEFVNDIKGLMQDLQARAEPEKRSNKMKVVFTDDPIDLLLCGTDVSGSCQRLEGIPEKNKGLLGYLMDGKNRLLAIKDGDKIAARCKLSLLWDGEKPVLYRERFYPDSIPSDHKTALNALSKKIAQKLNIPLTCGDEGIAYGKVLQSLGGPAPYEYSDGAGGVIRGGRYTIQNPQIME